MSAAGLPDAQMAQQADDRESSPAVNGKRKRDEEISDESRAAKVAVPKDEFYQLVDDLLLVLKSSSSLTPDILTRPIISAIGQDPTIKRAKLSPSPTPSAGKAATTATETTIQEQLDAKAYDDLDDLAADFDAAIDDLARQFDGLDSDHKLNAGTSIRSDNAIQARLLQSEVHSLLGIERRRHGKKSASSSGIKSRDDRIQPQLDGSSAGAFILTTFGTDFKGRGSSKQWFASRQHASTAAQTVDPVETALLPNGISATLMQSVSKPTYPKAPSTQKLGDLVPIPSQILALRPPPQFTSDMTRSQLVEWHKPPEYPPLRRPTNNSSWVNMEQPAGSWLSYSSNADIEESSAEKRMKRNRTLSGGERPDAAEVEFLQQSRLTRARAKKSSLFKSAYSSFAPSYDDTGAIIPAATRAQLWWAQAGSKLYEQYEHPEEAERSLEEQLQALDPQLRDAEDRVTEEEMKVIEETVGAGDLELDLDLQEGDSTTATADDLLDGISENIETLIDYQRDRMKVVAATPGKASITQHPSAAEEEIYETLKLSLASIVAMLPPAALSRLDGDKLKRLNISTKIPVLIPSSSGTFDMTEKSQAARPPVPTANRQSFSQGTPQPPRTVTQPRSAYANQPNTTTNRPAMPPQYSVPQPGRFAGSFTGATAQGSPLPNGYSRPIPNNYRPSQYSQYGNSPANTPTRPSGSHSSSHPAQGYQSRPLSYQMGNTQVSTAPNAAGRAGSPQRPASYNLPPSRTPYGPVPNAPMSAGHAASIYRPPSNSGPAPPNSQGTIGALVDISPEEQQQINRRAQEKQQQQDHLRQSSGSPHVPQRTTPQPTTPQSQSQQRLPTTNGIIQGSPSKLQGVQQAPKPQQPSNNIVNGA